MNLNEGQLKSVDIIKKFINSDSDKLLLLGPGGSGKTTVIVNAFNDMPEMKLAFCAFTNKATQVLYNISNKFNLKFEAEFLTIHKFLMLEPKINNKEILEFDFNIHKLDGNREYDVIIFDECSTINKELYGYIEQLHNYIYDEYKVKLKYIFIGDFWQLPPVSELNSIVFQKSVEEKWIITKLNEVMRSNNDHMYDINTNLINTIVDIKKNDNNLLSKFRLEYPLGILKKYQNKIYNNYDELTDHYLNKIKYEENSVILTYTNANCQKINYIIQDKIDAENNREITDREIIWFYPNDRCCLDKPINVCEIKEYKHKTKDYTHKINNNINNRDENKNNINNANNANKDNDNNDNNDNDNNDNKDNVNNDNNTNINNHVHINSINNINDNDNNKDNDNNTNINENYNDNNKDNDKDNDINIDNNTKTKEKKIYTIINNEYTTLYNGEIFIILHTEFINIRTNINKYLNNIPYFPGQLLYIKKLGDIQDVYKLLYIPDNYIRDAKKYIYNKRPFLYRQLFKEYNKYFPKLHYGYCITLYKSQGSEWHNVYINLNSIYYSIIQNKDIQISLKEKTKLLFKATYTALTRASNNLFVMWVN